jgi:hypothetical protein
MLLQNAPEVIATGVDPIVPVVLWMPSPMRRSHPLLSRIEAAASRPVSARLEPSS